METTTSKYILANMYIDEGKIFSFWKHIVTMLGVSSDVSIAAKIENILSSTRSKRNDDDYNIPAEKKKNKKSKDRKVISRLGAQE